MSICLPRSARMRWAMALGLLALGLAPAALAQAPATATATKAPAAKALTLKEAVQNAVLNNPEVLARWHTIKAADGERDAGAGGFLPKVDLQASTGPESRGATSTLAATQLNRSSVSLTISQMLYDGFATRNDVKRLDHARLVRLFEFFDTSESVALEAAKAYYDVLRFRELLRLSEDNFVQHRSVFEQTERRVKAKVARGVDLEQIGARLSLAESNLLTDAANLHDATARFQRLMGMLPPQDMLPPPQLSKNIPVDATAAIREAQQRNGALRAAIENVRASNSALASRSGAYQPRFDLRLRRDQGNNLSGVAGRTDSTVAEVVMTWNLFNGLSDRARERQFAEQLNVAKDLRDKACRDIRQTLLIAYNDTRTLKEKIGYLDQNKVSVEKARNAYRLQFDIGQRTLLDLLDTENELFQSSRSAANAEQDLNIAYVRAHAGAGTLLPALELSKIETGSFPGLEQWNDGEDAAQHCPAEAVPVYVVDKPALIERAAEQVKQTALLNARERAILEVFSPPAAAPPATGASAPASTSNPVPTPRAIAPTPAPKPTPPAPAVSPKPPAVAPGAANSSESRLALENQTALLNARERAMQQVPKPQAAVTPATVPTAPAARTGQGVATSPEASAVRANPAGSAAPPAALAPASPAPSPAPSPAQPVAEPTPMPTPKPESSPDDADYSELRQALQGWRAAWSKPDVDAYLEFYAPDFVPAIGSDRETWKERRKAALTRASGISLEITDLTVSLSNATNAIMVFRQTYRSANYRDTVIKTLQWVKLDDRWLIVRESSVVPVSAGQ